MWRWLKRGALSFSRQGRRQYDIDSIRRANRRPAVHRCKSRCAGNHLPPRLFPGLEKVLLSSAEDLLWSVLATTCRRTPTQGKNVLEIISSTVQESETLHVGFGSPLIKLICLFGVPIEHSTAFELWST